MILLYVILSLSTLSGLILILAASIFMKDGDSTARADNIDTESIVERAKQSASDADEALLQINSISGQIMEELEDKYKELLFLYQMVDDKKSELLSISPSKETSAKINTNTVIANENVAKPADPPDAEPSADVSKNAKKMDVDSSNKAGNTRKGKNHNYSEIIDCHRNGMSITEIAKNYGIGKGEVKLIIDLYNSANN